MSKLGWDFHGKEFWHGGQRQAAHSLHCSIALSHWLSLLRLLPHTLPASTLHPAGISGMSTQSMRSYGGTHLSSRSRLCSRSAASSSFHGGAAW